MAGTFKESGQPSAEGSQKPEEALQVAERVLRQLAATPQRVENPASKAISAAEKATTEAIEAARQIRGTLHLDQRTETIERLDRMKASVLIIAAQSTGNPTLDRAHQEAVKPIITAIERSSVELGKLKDETIPHDQADRLGSAIKRIEGRADALERVIEAEKSLIRNGAPQDIIEGAERAFDLHLMMERSESAAERDALGGRFMLLTQRMPDGFKGVSSPLLSGEEKAQMLDSISKTISGLADPSSSVRVAETELDAAFMKASQAISAKRGELASALELESMTLSQIAAGKETEVLAKGIRDVQKDVGEMVEKLGKGPVGDDDIRRIAARIIRAKEMAADLHDITSESLRRHVGNVYDSALSVLKTGTKEESDALVFAAGQMKKTPHDGIGAVPQDKAREEYEKLAKAVADGAESSDLMSRMSKDVASSLDAEAKKAPPESAAALNAIAKRLAKAPTLDDLTSAESAIRIAQGMRDSIALNKLDANQRKTAEELFGRALAALRDGKESAPELAELAQRYCGSTRKTADKAASDLVNLHPERLQGARQFLGLDDRIESLQRQRDEMLRNGRLPLGNCRKAFDGIIEELVKARERMAQGDIASETLVARNAAALRARIGQDEPLRQKIEGFAKQNSMDIDGAVMVIARDDAAQTESKRLDALLATGQSMAAALSHHLGASQRTNAGDIYASAVNALAAGRLRDGNTLRDAAETAASTMTKTDSDVVALICRGANDRAMNGADGFTQNDLMRLQVQKVRSTHEGGVHDPKLARECNAYFDIALRATDPQTMQACLDMAVLFSGMAAIPEKDLGKEDRQKRADAIAFVRENLGDYSRIGNRRVSGKAESITAPFARAAVSQGSVFDALAGQESGSAQERIGIGQKRFIALQKSLDAHMRSLEEITFERSLPGIEGRKSSVAEKKAAQETGRLLKAAKSAEESGNIAAARYFEGQAEFSGRQFITKSAMDARLVHARGMAEVEMAAMLGEDDAEARSRNMDHLIGSLPGGEQGAFRKRVEDAGSDASKIRSVYSDLLLSALPSEERRMFAEAYETMGRLDAGQLTDAVAKAVAGMGQGYRDAYEERMKSADAQQLREIYGQVLHLDLLLRNAQMHAAEGQRLITYARGIAGNLESIEHSVGLTTKRRESGRMELGVGTRTLIAIAKDQDVDLLGRPTGAPGRIPPGRVSSLERQAQEAGSNGRRMVQAQADIERVRDQGVRSAKIGLCDRNIDSAVQSIKQMIDSHAQRRAGEAVGKTAGYPG